MEHKQDEPSKNRAPNPVPQSSIDTILLQPWTNRA